MSTYTTGDGTTLEIASINEDGFRFRVTVSNPCTSIRPETLVNTIEQAEKAAMRNLKEIRNTSGYKQKLEAQK